MAKPANRKPVFNLGDPADDAPPKRTPRARKKGQDTKAPQAPANSPSGSEPRKSQSVYLPLSLIERARGLVGHAQYHGVPPEVSSLAELYTWALDKGIQEFEDKYNKGKPFPPPRGRLVTGPGRDGAERIRQARRKQDDQ